jgi:hypothetical protein
MERPHRLHRIRATSPLLLLAVAGNAFAAPTLPDPRMCLVEERVVGCPSGDPLPACPSLALSEPGFTVRVRDVNNAPVTNTVTVLRFTDPAIRLYEDLRPGTTVDCINRSLRRMTDSQGWVTFSPRISGTSAAPVAAELSAMTIVFGEVPVTTTDLDGDQFTGLSDFVIVATHYASHSSDRRTDYDGCVDPVDGATTLADLVLFATQFGRPAPDGICN